MKGHTHILFGSGFVSLLFMVFRINFILWIIGVLIVSPFFSRIPDRDQVISKITFDQVIPHRGKATHNLLYGIPLFLVFFLYNVPTLGELLSFLLISIFGSLFAHSFVDMFNYGGIWIGILKIKGFLRCDSVIGNLFFQLGGLLMILLSCFSYISL